MKIAGHSFPLPVLSLRMQRQLQDRHDVMQKWHGIAIRAGKNSPEYESWQRRVDRFLADIEGSIYLMGFNRLDHGRAGEIV